MRLADKAKMYSQGKNENIHLWMINKNLHFLIPYCFHCCRHHRQGPKEVALGPLKTLTGAKQDIFGYLPHFRPRRSNRKGRPNKGVNFGPNAFQACCVVDQLCQWQDTFLRNNIKKRINVSILEGKKLVKKNIRQSASKIFQDILNQQSSPWSEFACKSIIIITKQNCHHLNLWFISRALFFMARLIEYFMLKILTV